MYGMPMKFSQVDGMVKLNIHYTFAVMAKNCDVIITSENRSKKFGFEAIKKSFFQDYFLLFC